MSPLHPWRFERAPRLTRWRLPSKSLCPPSRWLHVDEGAAKAHDNTRLETPPAIIPPWRKPQTQKAASSVHIRRPHVLPPSTNELSAKIHILGDDPKSKYLAHALSGLQNHIELLSWRPTRRGAYSRQTYDNVQLKGPDKKESATRNGVVTNSVVENPEAPEESNEPITELVLTGTGAEAIPALNSVKHRLNNKTTVLLMSDGLGVLEDVRRRIFQNPYDSPNFLLGHMTHKLAFNRKHNAVKVLKNGSIKITDQIDIRFGKPRLWTPGKRGRYEPPQSKRRIFNHLENAKVDIGLTEYAGWLRAKLPTLMFDSIVEPVCVLLGVRYAGLLQNPAARHLLRDLTSEISNLVQHLPEIEDSPSIQRYIEEENLTREMFRAIIAKKDQPSQMAIKVEKGLPTDVNYLHGYFLRRAADLDLDLRTSALVRSVIKARHSVNIEKRNDWVRVDEMSIPPGEEAFKYRTP